MTACDAPRSPRSRSPRRSPAARSTQPTPPELDLPRRRRRPRRRTSSSSAGGPRSTIRCSTALIDEALANNLDLASRSRASSSRARSVLLAQSNLYPERRTSAPARRARASTERGASRCRRASPLDQQQLQRRHRSSSLRARPVGQVPQRRRSPRSNELARVAVLPRNGAHRGRRRRRERLLPAARGRRGARRPAGHAASCATDTVRLQRDRFEGGIIGELRPAQAEAERSGGRGRHRARRAGDRPARRRARDADRPLAARRVRAGGRARRDDRRVDRGAASCPRACRRACSSGVPTSGAPRRCSPRRDLRIQQARADYFPSISLTGAFGSESAALTNLFTAPASIWSFGAALAAAAVRR